LRLLSWLLLRLLLLLLLSAEHATKASGRLGG
jgi:hypothetical protein